MDAFPLIKVLPSTSIDIVVVEFETGQIDRHYLTLNILFLVNLNSFVEVSVSEYRSFAISLQDWEVTTKWKYSTDGFSSTSVF